MRYSEADAMLTEAARAATQDQDFDPFRVLADWYADRGESRLEGACRWVARFGKRPHPTDSWASPMYWVSAAWYNTMLGTSWAGEVFKCCVLPTVMYERTELRRTLQSRYFKRPHDELEAYRAILDAWDFDVADLEGPALA